MWEGERFKDRHTHSRDLDHVSNVFTDRHAQKDHNGHNDDACRERPTAAHFGQFDLALHESYDKLGDEVAKRAPLDIEEILAATAES